MHGPEMTLACSALEAVVRELEDDPASEVAWSAARAALDHHGVGLDDDIELLVAIEDRDAAALGAIVAGWVSGERLMLERDRDVLKRALKAYRKRLKVTLLDAESSVAGGPLSGGRRSTICGIVPPERYPREVWDALVRQKKLVDDGRGMYELAPGV